jgi:hypothetical protein
VVRWAKRVDDVERQAEEQVEREVWVIFQRYGNDPEQIMQHASPYEQKKLLDHIYPKLVDQFMEFQIASPGGS